MVFKFLKNNFFLLSFSLLPFVVFCSKFKPSKRYPERLTHPLAFHKRLFMRVASN